MGGVFSESGPGRKLVAFTDFAADGSERLEVAVLWRYPEPVMPPRSAVAVIGGILGAAFDVLRRSIGRPPSPPEPTWAPPEGWSGTWSGADGARAVLYHRERRRVRVLDEEHVVPADGRTMVLLVDATARATSAAATAPERPFVRTHALTLVAQSAEEREAPPPAGRRRRAWEQAIADAHRMRLARWRELLLADEVVRAFWVAPGEHGS